MANIFNQASFAKGEISPELYGRNDTSAYAIALRTAKNCIVHPYGSISNRPGTRFIGPVKTHSASPRLISFEFKTTDTYILEFGNQYMRVIRNDGHVTEANQNITGATQANPVVVTIVGHGYSSGQEIFISSVGGMTQINGKRFKITVLTADTFSLQDQVTGTNVDGTGYSAYTSGGTAARIYEIVTPYAIADLATLKYVQSSDVMTLTHPSYPVYQLTRTDHTAWTLTPLTVGATIASPPNVAVVPTTTGTTTYRYTVTALASDTLEESLAGLGRSYIMDSTTPEYNITITGISKAASAVVTTTGGAWTVPQTFKKFYISDVQGMTEINGHTYACTAHSGNSFTLNVNSTAFTTYTSGGLFRQAIDSITKANPAVVTMAEHNLANGEEIVIINCAGMVELNNRRYIANNVTTNTFELKDANGNNVDSTGYGTYTENGLIYTGFGKITNGNAVPNNTISWGTVLNTDSYIIYKEDNGVFSQIGQTRANSFVDNNIVPDPLNTPPRYRNPFDNSNYPGTVSYYEQRRVFGGSAANPDTSYYSQTGNTANFNGSSPLQDDDAITARLVSRQVNEIRHYVPQTDLIVLTSGGEWVVNSGPDSAFTPTTIKQRPQTQWGCSHIRPITIGAAILYLEDNNARIRNMGYSFQNDRYDSGNLSLFASHLTRDYPIVDWSYSHQPEPRIYMARQDGKALTMTYDSEQQVLAWTWWDTDGLFEKTASIRDTAITGDKVYFVVQRTVNGNTVRYIEKLDSRKFTTINDAFFVDCGGTYSGTPTTTISGLDWLEGKTVVGVADGVAFSGKVVTNGVITFASAVSTVQVGLAYTSDVETLDFNTQQYQTIGKSKKIVKIVIRFKDSQNLKVGQSSSTLYTMKMPTGLVSGDYEIRPGADWNLNGRIFIRQDQPLPMTILDIASEMVISP